MFKTVSTALFALAASRVVDVKVPHGFAPPQAAAGGCKPEIQLLHVQDSTATFAGVIKSFEEQKVIETLIDELRAEYGIVKYGLSTFQDKPAPFTGYGLGYSVWQEQWNNHYTWDKCYQNVLPMSGGEVANPWSSVLVSGGKDGEENQLDGMARAAVDPVHWPEGEATHNEFGHPIARLALMITDDFAHHGVKNDHHVWGFDVSYKGSTNYWNGRFGSFEEDYYDYRVKSDFAGATMKIPYGKNGAEVKLTGAQLYEAYVICQDSRTNDGYRKGTLKSWKNSGVDVGSTNVNSSTEAKAWWTAFCARENAKTHGKFTGVFAFANDYKLVESSAIQEYPYDGVAFDGSDDCTKYEYPVTSDSRYGDMFKKFGVIPLGVVAPPETSKPNDYTYRIKAYTIIANHCPKVRATCSSSWITDCTGPYGGSEWTSAELEQKIDDCYREHYGEFFQNLEAQGVPSVYQQMPAGKLDAAALAREMKDAIDRAVSSLFCQTTTSTSTLSTTTQSGASTDSTVAVTTAAPTTTAPTTQPETTVPSTAAPTTTTAPSTTLVVVPPPPPGQGGDAGAGAGDVGGDTIGIAVGSAAGGAAVVGGVVAAYMKGLIGGGSGSPDMAVVEQVEVPNQTADREQHQAVDFDMFN